MPIRINELEFPDYQTAITAFPYHHETLDDYYQLLDNARDAADTIKELYPCNDSLCEKMDTIIDDCDSEQSVILLDSECGCGETFSAYDKDICYVCNLFTENNSTEVPTDV